MGLEPTVGSPRQGDAMAAMRLPLKLKQINTYIMNKFIPTYLYIKEHSETKLKYFGKTVHDPLKYIGSGKYWLKHISFHGKDKVITIWSRLFTDKESLTEYATNFSISNNIVKSSDWANLDIETGSNGGYRINNHFKNINAAPMDANRRASIATSLTNNSRRAVPVTINNVLYPSLRNAAAELSITEQQIYYMITTGKAIKYNNFSSPRCSCIRCFKELSANSLTRHFTKHIK